VPNAAAHRKREFYEHVEMGITALTEGQTYWVSNLANASALLYHSFLGCSLYGMREDGEPVVNWTGGFFR
jgi:L-methionine (R)-S-oxide reductase